MICETSRRSRMYFLRKAKWETQASCFIWPKPYFIVEYCIDLFNPYFCLSFLAPSYKHTVICHSWIGLDWNNWVVTQNVEGDAYERMQFRCEVTGLVLSTCALITGDAVNAITLQWRKYETQTLRQVWFLDSVTKGQQQWKQCYSTGAQS